MARTKVNGVELYYEVHGDGPAILGIHGTPSTAVMWEDAAGELAAVGRCVIFDRRGFGRSERPEPFDAVDLDTHVEDAVALLEELQAVPAVVIGRSTGGQIALALAHTRPETVRALVLLEPALLSIDPEGVAYADRLRQVILRAADDDLSRAAEAVCRDVLGDAAWESFPEELRQMFADTSPAVLAEVRGRGLDLSEDALVLHVEDLARMDRPTLLVSAEDSPAPLRRVTARLADALPRTESVLVPGGHLIYPADPAVLDFVSRVVAGSG